jgi:hypothetical protein
MKGVIVIAGLDLGLLVAGSSLADKVKLEAWSTAACRSSSAPGFRFVDGKVYADPGPAGCRSPARP